VIVQIPYKPHQYQRLLHNDPGRFKIVAGGRRVGKTVACLQEAIRHCLSNDNQLCFWIAPTYHMAKEVGFEEFTKYISILKPAIFSIHHTQLKVTFINGSVLYFKGADNPDSLRGRGITLAIFDEGAFVKPEVWTKIIRPALSDRQGKVILISTPNGFNWFKDIWDKGDDWSKYLWTTELNPLISDEELLAVRREISANEYRQEYLAEFITKTGRVYDEWTGENIIPRGFPEDKEHDIFLGLDFGFAGYTAIAFFAVERATNNRVIQFDELYVSRKQMDEIIQLIRIKLAEYSLSQANVEMCYTDPAGNADELSSGLSPVDMLRNAGFKVLNKGSTINAGIALVRSFIKNSLGQIRYFVTENCTESIRCFNGYQYKEDKKKEEALKDGVHDHLMDAIRYFFVNKFDHAKYVASTPSQQAYSISTSKKIMKRCNKCHKPFISSTPVNLPPTVCTDCLKG
jgi:PBSX family phage terminase large subunit